MRSSTLINRNLRVGSRRTSVRLEAEHWEALADIARRESLSIPRLCLLIEQRTLPGRSMSSSLRVFIMTYYRSVLAEAEGAGWKYEGPALPLISRCNKGADCGPFLEG
jgi:predicted DNA-binding ribbon-helix-helix protein